MKATRSMIGEGARRMVLGCAVAGGLWLGGAGQSFAQVAPADLPPALQQVVNLSKAGMSDDFIETYITNSGRTYSLSVDDIIYLHSQGVSDAVMKTLIQPASAASSYAPPVNPVTTAAPNPADTTAVNPVSPAATTFMPPTVDGSAPPAVPVTEAAPATPTTLDYFQTQLAPYGNWLQVGGYGYCWQPAVNPGWRPYFDGGHWVETDSGWYWQSDYPWGDIPFHYGRWVYTTVGWVWVPGYQYAPAWVFWRQADADGYVGWAPLPPDAVFADGCWWFHGGRVGFDFDFGLGFSYFTFVDYAHFWVHDYRTCVLPGDRVAFIFGRSVASNRFREDHGNFYNEGLDRGHLAAFTHQEIHLENANDLRNQEFQHNEEIRRDRVSAYHNQSGGNQGWWNHNQPQSGNYQNNGRNGNPGGNQHQQPGQHYNYNYNNNGNYHVSYNSPYHYQSGTGSGDARWAGNGQLATTSYSSQNSSHAVILGQANERPAVSYASAYHVSASAPQHYQGGFSQGVGMRLAYSAPAASASHGGSQSQGGNYARSNR